ncbi:receptor-like_protein [Hexamita inflata]|uniref:Receptor-like protein n=1 Tax=Hexamita inflata TaxID=28002 RepID=A0AA86UGH8_9EUKA|nr:receptor-like protein [Hexamita inflata]
MEQNNNNLNKEYDDQMYRKYEGKIQDGNLEIGKKTEFDNWPRQFANVIGDPEVTNLMFVEKFNIQTLKIFISNDICIKIQSKTIKKINLEQTAMDCMILTDNNFGGQLISNPKKLNMQIDNLELENLEVLDLHHNSLENDQLQNLAKFKKLHTLNVSRNNVDLTHIQYVSSLTKLSMRECNLNDINQITLLTNLADLDLSGNTNLDLSPLCKVKSLSKLFINNCGLKNIEKIVLPTNLEVLSISDNFQLQTIYIEVLDASYNQLQNIDNIHYVTSLTKLFMRKCRLTNIDQITYIVNLEELDISYNNCIKDISPLYQVRSLTKLFINNCGLKNIDQIAQLINLEVLNVSDNQLLTTNSIGSLVKLKELDISKNDNLDINSLKDLVSLIQLNLRSCALTQLSALKPLINLQDLNLSFNPDINITELQYLKNLKYLNLKNCDLVSIYVLKPLINLEELNISNNNIAYLDANINEMTNLKEFSVVYNLVIDFSELEQQQNFNSLDEYGDRYFDISAQKTNSQEELRKANKMRKIESPNSQLKQNQNQHKALKTALNECKQKINAVLTCADHIQFTSSVAQLFELLNQPFSQ